MANDVVSKTSPLPPALIQKIADGLARSYGGSGQALRLGMPILKMAKGDGSWSFGQENSPVQKGSRWMADIGSFQHGVVVWSESKIVHEEMVDGWEPAPPIPTQPHPTGQPYKRQSSFKLRCLDGEDEGTVVIYKINSDGGNERTAELGRKVGVRIGQHGDGPYLFPVLQLGADFYDNKQHGSRIWKPIFEIVDWADAEGNLEDSDNVVAMQKAVEEPKPAKPAKPPLEPAATGQRRRPGR